MGGLLHPPQSGRASYDCVPCLLLVCRGEVSEWRGIIVYPLTTVSGCGGVAMGCVVVGWLCRLWVSVVRQECAGEVGLVVVGLVATLMRIGCQGLWISDAWAIFGGAMFTFAKYRS